jgi:hypothetical protein
VDLKQNFLASKPGHTKMKQNALISNTFVPIAKKKAMILKNISIPPRRRNKFSVLVTPQSSVSFLLNKIRKQKNGQ